MEGNRSATRKKVVEGEGTKYEFTGLSVRKAAYELQGGRWQRRKVHREAQQMVGKVARQTEGRHSKNKESGRDRSQNHREGRGMWWR